MEGTVHSKLPGLGTTIFTEMSALAVEHGALNLAQGFPDLPPPQGLVSAAEQALRDGVHQYAPMAGRIGLRHWICEHHAQRHGAAYDVGEECTIGAGASSLIFAAIQALVHPGQEVVPSAPAAMETAVRLLKVPGRHAVPREGSNAGRVRAARRSSRVQARAWIRPVVDGEAARVVHHQPAVGLRGERLIHVQDGGELARVARAAVVVDVVLGARAGEAREERLRVALRTRGRSTPQRERPAPS